MPKLIILTWQIGIIQGIITSGLSYCFLCNVLQNLSDLRGYGTEHLFIRHIRLKSLLMSTYRDTEIQQIDVSLCQLVTSAKDCKLSRTYQDIVFNLMTSYSAITLVHIIFISRVPMVELNEVVLSKFLR